MPSADRQNEPPSRLPLITLPKGGGALRSIDEKFSVNAANGTCNLRIPLPFSPARSAVGIQLVLEYSSGAGNSVFGLGGSVDLPCIQRRTDKQLPRYEDANESDVFLLSGSEDLVPALVKDQSGTWIPDVKEVQNGPSVRRYRPRMEGLFARIEKISVPGENVPFWRVTTRDNVTTIFGRTAAARIADPTKPDHIFKWLPEWVFDDKGNCAEYVYKDEDLQNVPHRVEEKNRLSGLAPITNKHLKRIHYGNQEPYFVDRGRPFDPAAPNALTYLFETVFDYGEHDAVNPTPAAAGTWPCRFDPFSDYRAGFEVRTYRMCRRVLFFHTFRELGQLPCLVRSLDFDHAHFHFDGAPYESQEVDFIVAVRRTHFKPTGANTYASKSLPALELTYQPMSWDKAVRTLSPEDVIGAPGGVGEGYQWYDLYSDGAPGILTEQASVWFYKQNLGGGHFSRAATVLEKPSLAGLSGGSLQLQDLGADGCRQLVSIGSQPRGFFELGDDGAWRPCQAFDQLVNVDLRDPETKLLDLNGDGAPDLLVTEENVFRWYPSLGRRGYDSPELAPRAYDEELGPAVVFNDGTQALMTADMTGDGLADIVRVRNAEVCYWPNLGYGRFGPKVTMGNAPLLDHPEAFDPGLVRLADVNGTGASDLIYLGQARFSAFINLAGNALSDAQTIDPFPGTERPNRVEVLDVLGNGTSCLVWSSGLPANSYSPIRYVDLMGGKKPYVVSAYKNNLGAEVQFEYRSSSYFALLDKAAGKPWATKLPFPTMCVSRVETSDLVTGAKFVRRYRYRHGYYDHAEREFRGFGMVEQIDSESFDKFLAGGASNVVDASVFQAPVRTRTWFHTGAYIGGAGILTQFATDYYQGETTPEFLLPDAVVDTSVDTDEPAPIELQQAIRGCKGMTLRQETYADDGTTLEQVPYSTSEHNCIIKMVQPKRENRYAVFLAHESEAISYHYERDPSDPRILHDLNTVVDDHGNVVESASVVYARRNADGGLSAAVQAEQARIHAVYTVNRYTNDVDTDADHRTRALCDAVKYELTGKGPKGGCFGLDEIGNLFAAAAPLAFEQPPHASVTEKRAFSHLRTLFASDADVNSAAPFGTLGALGLTFEEYRLAFTPSLLTALYGGRVTNAMLTEGAYLAGDDYLAQGLFPNTDDAGNCWTRSGRVHFPPNPGQSFYLPDQHIDPFGNASLLHYLGNYHLMVDQVTDPLGNQVTVEQFDFRFLLPTSIKDQNDNLSDAALDIFGLTVGIAFRGKGNEADDLIGFHADLSQNDIDTFLADPVANGPGLLVNATTRFVYRFETVPSVAASIVRETHSQAALRNGAPSKLQYAFEYSTGLGKVAMKKVQTEPGKALRCDLKPDGTYAITQIDTTPDLRWIGTGRTVLNNKGSPVMQYEPYFSVTPKYETAQELVQSGVTPVLHYDPLGRLIRTDFPDGSFSTEEFDAWSHKSFDQNDNVLASAWYAARKNGALGTSEQAAAQNTAIHDSTPLIVSFDSLGRDIYSVAHNKFLDRVTQNSREEFYATLTALDIAGNHVSLIDPRGNVVVQNGYDMLDRACSTLSMDAGPRRVLADVAGQPLYRWDAKGNRFHTRYDQLRRPLEHERLDGSNAAIVFDRAVYGTNKINNQVGQVAVQFDGSGRVTHDSYDFKGNLLSSTRTFTVDHVSDIDWSAQPAVPLEQQTYTTQTSFDAFGRPISSSTPDNSVVTLGYDESGLLSTIQASVKGTPAQPFILSVTRNEKHQRLQVRYANGVVTKYTYDPLTFRVRRIRATKPDGTALQDLSYVYDPVGNITHIADRAQQTIYFNGTIVPPQNDFTYDATYRLVSATGREHIGQNSPVSRFDEFRTGLPQPGDVNAMRNYLQQYDYDFAGNMLNMVHSSGLGPYVLQWTRQLTVSSSNNRLVSSTAGGITENYDYDLHGNMKVLSAMPTLGWDFLDRLRSVDLGGGGIAYYTYDATGNRVRKVIESRGGAVSQRLYLGSVELYRETQGNKVKTERESLHLFDGDHRFVIVDSMLQGEGSANTLIRYQFSNHLGTATMEFDEKALPISYEEYYPYGSTSFHSVDSSGVIPAKQYRYTGKERDGESGLYYHGARYYAPWIARWTACDPDPSSSNPYVYCSNNPERFLDPNGAWQVDMHFVMVYWTGRMSNETHDTALRVALASQMPDERLDLIERRGGLESASSLAAPGLKARFLLSSDYSLLANTLHSLGTTRAESERLVRSGIRQHDLTIFGLGLHVLGDYLPHGNTSGWRTAGHGYQKNEDKSASRFELTAADKTFKNPRKAEATSVWFTQMWALYRGKEPELPSSTSMASIRKYVEAEDYDDKRKAFMGWANSESAKMSLKDRKQMLSEFAQVWDMMQSGGTTRVQWAKQYYRNEFARVGPGVLKELMVGPGGDDGSQGGSNSYVHSHRDFLQNRKMDVEGEIREIYKRYRR